MLYITNLAVNTNHDDKLCMTYQTQADNFQCVFKNNLLSWQRVLSKKIIENQMKTNPNRDVHVEHVEPTRLALNFKVYVIGSLTLKLPWRPLYA